MQVLHIALKDLLRSSRSTMFYVFGFGIPILTTLIFFFAFGGTASDGEFEMAQIRVQVVNQDAPGSAYGGFSAGGMLLEFLQGDQLVDLLLVTEADDVDSARTAVDQQQADVAILIPPNFTAAVVEPEENSSIEMYKDPTLTLGPGIVKGLISQFVDGFSGSKIAIGVIEAQLGASGVPIDSATRQEVMNRYADWARSLGQTQQQAANTLLEVQSPGEQDSDMRTRILSLMMSGMMVFYVFFTGATSAQSILQEEEEGTLPRLFTTPTPQSTILAGKFLATFATLVIQIVVLLLGAALIFNLHWGKPLPLTLVSVALIVVAASTGIFLTSLLKNTRQSGIIYGGVLTMAGMVGMISIFTMGATNRPKILDTISLFVPQGWAVMAWRQLLEGGGVEDVLLPVGVMLGIGLVFFLIGTLRFRKRFA